MQEKAKGMKKSGYRFVGRHAAIKICEWCREALRGNGLCYKQKFYGIASHRCVQMSPIVDFCTENCIFCWRTIDYTEPKKPAKFDKPEEILDGCIEAQRKILQGFKGNPKTEKNKFVESMQPKHVAISLAGEPTLYPFLPQLVKEINSRGMTSFLVTNGTIPEMIKKLEKHQPYQLYVTLAAPNQKIFEKVCRPLIKDAWKRLIKTLSLLKKFRRTVVRLTLVKGLNMTNPRQYAKIIEKASPTFVEVKAFMSVGGARNRLGINYMPRHEEIVAFSKRIERNSSYKIVDEKRDSRVVLMKRLI